MRCLIAESGLVLLPIDAEHIVLGPMIVFKGCLVSPGINYSVGTFYYFFYFQKISLILYAVNEV